MPIAAAVNFRRNAWLVVGLLWVTACLNYLDRLMITTMRSSLMETIPMTEAQQREVVDAIAAFYAADRG